MRLAVLFISFQRTVVFLGLKQEASTLDILNPEQSADVEKIGWSLRAVSARTPWESACLTQALAGMVMLQRRGIQAFLLLGVSRADSGPDSMAAHAWLKCGEAIVTGAGGHERFIVISTFAGKCSR
jgi:hypothetical protein